LGLSACTAGQTGPPPVTVVNPTTAGKLQLAVGTANVAGTPGLNVVATYRQANGASAVLVNTPKLTGPFTLPAAAAPSGFYAGGEGGLFNQGDPQATADAGPSADEVSGRYIGGTAQTQASNPNQGLPTTLGSSGGVFGNGFFPGNYTSSGNPYSYNPFYQPFYAGNDGTPDTAFLSAGGPPVFDPNRDGGGTQDGSFSTPIKGISLGLNVFAGVTPGAGQYNLQVTIPTAGFPVVSAPAATLSSTALLPAAATPVVSFNGDGSGRVSYVLPAGVAGAYVQLVDLNYCNGGSPVPYTFWVTASGSQAIPNTLGPKGRSGGPAICTAAMNSTSSGGSVTTGDPVQAVLIGFDYDHNALQYNGTTGQAYPQAPTLPARADVTISPIATYTLNPDGTVSTSAHRRAAGRRR
ncbi:MAG: hypothetical protein QOI11_2307, partial [Candidatus Eremiobacteraeota bacterium]|nr:hypothetical protein [Candidatus Eremiobacteraeota bacterium]